MWKGKLVLNKNIAVAGTGYVGLSIATLLAQHHKVFAVDILPEKVELINNKKGSSVECVGKKVNKALVHQGFCYDS